ncbi:hypothetical protein FQN50_008366 [Emmonsiellopsis sp. PD_5]|nr:hypothetical protein FQN50_008366 [Emmonsiellopsis sp. PD_5]
MAYSDELNFSAKFDIPKESISQLLRTLDFDPRGKGHFEITENGVLLNIAPDGGVVDKVKLEDSVFEEYKASRAKGKTPKKI